MQELIIFYILCLSLNYVRTFVKQFLIPIPQASVTPSDRIYVYLDILFLNVFLFDRVFSWLYFRVNC